MNNSDYLKLRSVKQLTRSIKKTDGLIGVTVAARVVLHDLYEESNDPKKRKFKDLKFDKQTKSDLIDLGIIGLFANFEAFQYELTRELLKKNPAAYNSERMITVEELGTFKTIKQAQGFYLDSYASNKTHNLEEWIEYMDRCFGIKLFKNKGQVEMFLALNEMRNIILHTAGKMSSNFHRKMRTLLKSFPGKSKLREKLGIDREKLFHHTRAVMLFIAKGEGLKGNKTPEAKQPVSNA